MSGIAAAASEIGASMDCIVASGWFSEAAVSCDAAAMEIDVAVLGGNGVALVCGRQSVSSWGYDERPGGCSEQDAVAPSGNGAALSAVR